MNENCQQDYIQFADEKPIKLPWKPTINMIFLGSRL